MLKVFPYWLRFLSGLVLVVSGYLPTMLSAQTVYCGFLEPKVRFSDGTSACLKSFSFFNRSGVMPAAADQTYAGIAASKSTYAIAITADPDSCPFAQSASWNWGRMEAQDALPRCDERLQQAVQEKGKAGGATTCKCDVLVDNGKTALTPIDFAARLQRYERQMALGMSAIKVAEADNPAPAVATQTQDIQVPGGASQDAERVQANLLVARQAMEEEDRKAALALALKQSQESARIQAAALAAAQVEAARQADRLRQVELEERLRMEAAAAAQRQQAAAALSDLRAKEAKLSAAEPAVAAPQVSQVAQTSQVHQATQLLQASQVPQVVKLTARALVIGNGAYTHFGRLANARNDAQDIADKLRSFGIEVDLVLDADRDKLVKALNDYAERAVGKDVNLLFYAGHGVQIEGVNYIIPTSMRADGVSAGYVKLNGVALNAVMDYMPAKTRLIFLDACRDNPASRSMVASRSSAGVGLAAVTAATGTLIAYATKEGAVAADGLGKNSPYTTALLRHLDAPLDIGIILRRVRQTVLQLTSNGQEPWEYGSLVGDQLILSQMAR
jgi:hypothetical protein